MSDFLTIDENSIPEGGDNFGPLTEGPYEATCVAMVKGIGTKFQSDETEQKVRFVFAVQGEERIEYLRTNWMKISLWDGEPNPSALWVILSAWTNQKTAEKLIEKMGKFDLKFFIGKPITLGVKLSKDEKWNVISDYYAPKKGAAVITAPEIPEFFLKGDKRVSESIGYITMEGATVKAAKKAEKASEPEVKGGGKKAPAATATQPVDTEACNSDELPFN